MMTFRLRKLYFQSQLNPNTLNPNMSGDLGFQIRYSAEMNCCVPLFLLPFIQYED